MDAGKFKGHTPGPWEIRKFVNKSKPKIMYDSGKEGYLAIATISRYCSESGYDDKRMNANAALIAAAPDLLAEVERLRERVAELEAEADE